MVSIADIESAERLVGIAFTAAERVQMLWLKTERLVNAHRHIAGDVRTFRLPAQTEKVLHSRTNPI